MEVAGQPSFKIERTLFSEANAGLDAAFERADTTTSMKDKR